MLLGSGDWQYEKFFGEMAGRYPNKFGLRIVLSHPSQKDICGHGYIPDAVKERAVRTLADDSAEIRLDSDSRGTGGLKDTITDSGDDHGNGFVFWNYNAHEMKYSIERALKGFENHDGWATLTKRAMMCDNSWGASANQYIRMYNLF